jgi:thiol-disulfide isomerase/thioredoxin
MLIARLFVLAALITIPVAAVAAEEPARPLADVLAAAKAHDKLALLDFGAVWCLPCKMLTEAMAKPELQPLVDAFVLVRYDAERGPGKDAAARYDVHTFPTLIVVDAEGRELARQDGFDDDVLPGWLKLWRDAGGSESALQARATQGDIAAMFVLAERARTRHDEAAQRRWLAAVTSADKSDEHKDAERAAWMRLELDATTKLQATLRPLLFDFAQQHPAQANRALTVAARVGGDGKQLQAAFDKVIAAVDDGHTLGLLASSALDADALDAALHAAQKQRERHPDDAAALDHLAEVLSARGDKQRAAELEKEAIAKAKDDQRATLQQNQIARANGFTFRNLMQRASLERFLFGEEQLEPKKQSSTPVAVARNFLANESHRLATCASAAPPGINQVYVRLRVGTTHLEGIELLEPRATAKFKRCVDKALHSIVVPPDSEPAHLVMQFNLHEPSFPH